MQQLINKLTLLDLPSTTWGVHIHPKHEFVGILHMIISSSKMIIDKGVLLVEENDCLKTRIFLNGFVTQLPNINLDVKSIYNLSDLLYSLHNKYVCTNSVDDLRRPQCLKLIDSSLDNDIEDNIKYCCICRKTLKAPAELTNLVVYDEAKPYNAYEQTPAPDRNKLEECKRILPTQDLTGKIDLIVHKKYAEPSENEESKSKPTKAEEKFKEKQRIKKQELCNVCGKVAPGYWIEQHMLTHTRMKPFQCKVCDKAFAKTHNLRMHEHTHSGKRPYICSACGKTYTTSSNLRTHMISCQNEEKKHVCDICKKAFIYPRYLKMHMRKHTGEKPFMCSVCGKSFSKNIHLTIHMRIHTGEKPHCCNVCGRGFTTTGGLGYHKKAHHRDSNLL